MENKEILTQKLSIAKLNRKLIMFVLILLLLFFVAQFLATSKIGTKSVEINQVRMQKDELRLKTELIKSEIDQEMTIAKIEPIINKLQLQSKEVTELQSADGSNNNIAMDN